MIAVAVAVVVTVVVTVVVCSAFFGVALWLIGRAADYDDLWRN